MNKPRYFLLFFLLFFACSPLFVFAADLSGLKGRILLQVQDKGQAWYYNPTDGLRYYLGRPDDAFALMRRFGLGVSNRDFAVFEKNPPRKFAGRILLKVEDGGRAYYLDPSNLHFYYLGRPADAFAVIRSRGLGISNQDLSSIKAADNQTQQATAPSQTSQPAGLRDFSFKYLNQSQSLALRLSDSLYQSYKSSPKVITYQSGHEPANLREEFYGLFLTRKNGDTYLEDVAAAVKEAALKYSLSEDRAAEYALAFIQYIPYDQTKAANNNGPAYFPYETLYLNRGVCSDKSFLGVAVLRKLGYGAAILDFPERNHSAVGIQCPKADSINGSGYCYVETTNYFPFGVIPESISSGQAQNNDSLANLFDASRLGNMEIYQATQGKLYYGVSSIKSRAAYLAGLNAAIASDKPALETQAASLSAKESEINVLRSQLEAYSSAGNNAAYNNLVPTYNTQVNVYNADLADYRSAAAAYNSKVNEYNQGVRDFYQQ